MRMLASSYIYPHLGAGLGLYIYAHLEAGLEHDHLGRIAHPGVEDAVPLLGAHGRAAEVPSDLGLFRKGDNVGRPLEPHNGVPARTARAESSGAVWTRGSSTARAAAALFAEVGSQIAVA